MVVGWIGVETITNLFQLLRKSYSRRDDPMSFGCVSGRALTQFQDRRETEID